MKIRIKPNSGIYGKDGEIEGGTVLTLDKAPAGWEGRYDVIEDGSEKAGKTAVVNPAEGALKAEHHGGGKFNITQGETVLQSGLSKSDADAFNAMSDEDKAAFVKPAE